MRVPWMVVVEGEVVWEVGGGGSRATEERLSMPGASMESESEESLASTANAKLLRARVRAEAERRGRAPSEREPREMEVEWGEPQGGGEAAGAAPSLAEEEVKEAVSGRSGMEGWLCFVWRPRGTLM